MGKVRIYLLCSIFCLFFWSLGSSEIITLKSGQKVEGRIIEQTNKYVKLDFQGVEVIYLNDEIAAINQADSNNYPQIESLYKAYAASLNAPKKPKAGRYKDTVALTQVASKSSGQGVPAAMPILDFQLPAEYQEMVKSAMSNLQIPKPGEVKPKDIVALGQVVSKPDSQTDSKAMSVQDLSQLPAEYQEMVKSAMSSLQIPKPGEKKR